MAEGRITIERAAELLRIEPADVPAIAAGQVELTRYSWHRLLRDVRVEKGS